MSEYIATAICYFAFGLSVGLLVAGYWLHTEHVEWKAIVDKYAAIVDAMRRENWNLATMLQSLNDIERGRTTRIEEVIDKLESRHKE